MEDWKQRILTTLFGQELSMEDGCGCVIESSWERRAWLSVLQAAFPRMGRLRTWEDVLRPRSLGALVGHKRSGWRSVAKIAQKALRVLKRGELSQGKLQSLAYLGLSPGECEEGCRQMLEEHQKAKRAMRRCLLIAQDLPHEEASEFLEGHAVALKFGTLREGLRFEGESEATLIHQFLLAHGDRCQTELRSLAELHDVLCHCYGKQVIGEPDRLRKICDRLGYKIGKPGRPPKKRDIGELLLSVFPPAEGWNPGGHESSRRTKTTHAEAGSLQERGRKSSRHINGHDRPLN